MNEAEQNEMMQQDELTQEQEAVFFGQVIKALGAEMGDKGKEKPTAVKVHPRLYEQLVPAYKRIANVPIKIFTMWLGQDIGVPYGSFIFETKTDGVIKGH